MLFAIVIVLFGVINMLNLFPYALNNERDKVLLMIRNNQWFLYGSQIHAEHTMLQYNFSYCLLVSLVEHT